MKILIQKNKLKKYSLIYCCLPVICFTCFYMQSIIGYCTSGVLLCAVILLCIKTEKEQCDSSIVISGKILLILILIALLWCAFGGQGNHYYQSHDWNCRNAVYRDLIYKDWPVIYEKYNLSLIHI